MDSPGLMQRRPSLRLPILGDGKSLLILILLALLGAAIVMVSTPHGLGVSDDSVIYLGAARNLLDGNGLSRLEGDGSPHPITHYPPGYSLVLAAWQFAGGPFQLGARLIAALAFAVSIASTGLLAKDITASPAIGLLTSLLLALSPVALEVETWAMSEPIFVGMALVSLWLLRRYRSEPKALYLYASAFAIALALLTRYVGYTLLLVAGVTISTQPVPGRKRLRDLLRLIMLAMVPMVFWIGRNLLLTGSATNRQLAWHPVRMDKLRSGLLAVAEWIYGGQPPALWMALPALAVVLAIYGIFVASRWPRGSDPPEGKRKQAADLLLPGFSAIYLAALLVSISLFDYSTPLDRRLLFPLYPVFLVVGVGTLQFLWSRLASIPLLRGALVALLLAGVTRYAWETGQTALELRADARGFASHAWQEGAVVEYLQGLPVRTFIYTNEPVAVYYLVGRGSYTVPIRFDSVVGKPRDDYQQAMAEMRARLQAGEAVLVLLDSIRFQTDLAPEQELIRGLEPAASDPQMRLYVAPAE